MKKILVILGFVSAILAVILAVTPLFKLAVFPTISAFICGITLLYLSNKRATKTKTIQYIFLLAIVSLSFTVYKSVFQKTELGDVEQLDKLEDASEEDAIKELEDIDIDG